MRTAPVLAGWPGQAACSGAAARSGAESERVTGSAGIWRLKVFAWCGLAGCDGRQINGCYSLGHRHAACIGRKSW